MPRYDHLPPSLAPRGLSRLAAAQYAGMSPSLFDSLVEDGRMPTPFTINRRKFWDRRKLDLAIDKLSGGAVAGGPANPWDDSL